MRILVTGGAGFIGSNFIRYMLEKHDDVEICNLDSLTYAGNLENLADVAGNSRYVFIKGDIASEPEVMAVVEQHMPDVVVNFAAESHVDRSIHLGAGEFIRTNICGTQNLLDAARAAGTGRFVQISTDEVYGSAEEGSGFSEKTPLSPNNPYSATKASADLLVRAANKSYGLDTVITRCSNNFGPYQFPEKLIPLMVINALQEKPLPIYGDGLHMRDWIFVSDHCSAIDLVMRKGRSGEVYNIGGTPDFSNLDIVRMILGSLGKPESLIQHIDDRPGHDRRYAMDYSKITAELGWKPEHSFDEAMELSVKWYTDNRDWWRRVQEGSYREYYEKIYGLRMAENRGKA
ncbi:MAG: dTDP-glucose 4,6-dehydratase [Verrucomicrobiota bacterium]